MSAAGGDGDRTNRSRTRWGAARAGRGPSRRSLRGDERGVSISITHVLTVAITTVLIVGLLISANALIETQRERAVTQGMNVVGERLADEFEQAERLALRSGTSVTLRTRHPDRIGGQSYTVSLVRGSDPACSASACLVLDAARPEERRVVGLTSEVPVTESTVVGGNVQFRYDGTNMHLERREGV
jgi:hypothetical protein